MIKKIIYIALAALLGAGVGAFFSYGPLKLYKSEAILNIDMDIPSYKRFALLVNNPARFRQYAAHIKPLALTDEQIKGTLQDITSAGWLKPVPRFTKSDIKDLPDISVRLEQENIKLKEQNQSKEIEKINGDLASLLRNDYSAYTGFHLTSLASEPEIAVSKLNWLSNYVSDTAAHSAVDQLLAKWINDNQLLEENLPAVKIQNDYAIGQLKIRIAGLRKVNSTIPEASKADIQSFTLAMQNPSNAITPRARLIATELELLDLESINHKIESTLNQQKTVTEITQQVSISEHLHKSGYDRIKFLDNLLTVALKKTVVPHSREKLLSMRIEVSNIKARVYKKPAYTLQASSPTKQGPSPLKTIGLCSIFLALLMSIFIWRKVFMKHLIQDASTLIQK